MYHCQVFQYWNRQLFAKNEIPDNFFMNFTTLSNLTLKTNSKFGYYNFYKLGLARVCKKLSTCAKTGFKQIKK